MMLYSFISSLKFIKSTFIFYDVLIEINEKSDVHGGVFEILVCTFGCSVVTGCQASALQNFCASIAPVDNNSQIPGIECEFRFHLMQVRRALEVDLTNWA